MSELAGLVFIVAISVGMVLLVMAVAKRAKSTPGFSIKASDAQHLETRRLMENELPQGTYAAVLFRKGTSKDEAIQFLDESRRGIESGELFPDQPVKDKSADDGAKGASKRPSDK